LIAEWPRLTGRVRYLAEDLRTVRLAPSDVVVSSHACGTLTDDVLNAAAEASARVAVLPCCHDLAECHSGPLVGWLDGALAVDVMRAVSLAAHGYHVRTQTIPSGITPKNRLLIGTPPAQPRPNGNAGDPSVAGSADRPER
jgi:hypothetical protein